MAADGGTLRVVALIRACQRVSPAGFLICQAKFADDWRNCAMW
jgi:hypothetical protein